MRPSAATICYCLASLVAAASGCASGSSAEKVPPETEALRASHRQVRSSVEDAYRESENLDAYTLPARYNPPRCDAPAFEVRAHGRWTRVYLKAGDELQKKLEALKPEDEAMVGAGEPVTFEGRWRGSREAETGLEYPVFQVRQIVD